MDVTTVIYRRIDLALGLLIGVLATQIMVTQVVIADELDWKDSSIELELKGVEVPYDLTTHDLASNDLAIEGEASHKKARYLRLGRESLEQSNLNFFSDNELSELISKEVSLPLPNGTTLTVKVVPSSLLSERLSKQFNIYTYRVLPDNNVISGRLGYSTHGFHSMIQMRSGDTFIIDPLSASNENTQVNQTEYVSYRKQDQTQSRDNTYSCGVKASPEVAKSTIDNLEQSYVGLRNDSNAKNRLLERTQTNLLTYKIAIAATGEYVAVKGGTVAGALSAIVTTLSRVNQVYEQDLGIHLQLIDNNDELIYLDASTDPYYANDLDGLINQNQQNINAVIGADNYDIGHLFTTKGGGLTVIGSVCNPQRKSQGVSGINNPSNDSFNLDFVAHEIGHQLGATHTFNGIEGLCSSNTRTARTAFEPGSGSTVMSYAGYCGVDNLQSHSDAMFHIGSINQIRNFTTNDRGSRCGIRRQSQNSPPSVDAGRDYKIPALTPFELSGTAIDEDGDQLVYAWEQIDFGTQSQPNSDTGDNPLFRVHFPSTIKSRSFPPIGNILNHSSSKGEVLPNKERSLNFSFVAQDGFNAAESDEMSISVFKTGSRFALNMPRTGYSRGQTHKIFWNTANTERAPINCDAVDVHISHDGGWNFERKIATEIPNSGEAWISIPSDFPLTNRGRFKLACSDNVFFAVSYRDFKVSKQTEVVATLYRDEDQPEKNLSDDEQATIDPPTIQAIAQNVSTAGGSIEWLFVNLLFLISMTRLSRVRIIMGTNIN